MPFRELQYELSTSKSYLNAELKEDFGISVVEAMSAGCVPVVYKDGGFFTDIIDKGKYGFAWETVGDIVHQIRSLISDKEKFMERSTRAIERAKAFSALSLTTRFSNLHRKVCSGIRVMYCTMVRLFWSVYKVYRYVTS